MVGVREVLQEGPPGLAGFRRDFRQPDSGFDGFDLTEKRADVVELVMAPMLK